MSVPQVLCGMVSPECFRESISLFTLHHLAWGTKDHCLAEASRTVKYSSNIFKMGLYKRPLIQVTPFWLPVFRKRTLTFRRAGSLKSHLAQPKSDVL